jgi:membrane-associated phospholipid phosphatase
MTSSRRTAIVRTASRLWWLPLAPLGFIADRGSRARWLLMPAVVILTALTSSLGKLAIRRPRPGSSDRVVPRGRLGAAGFPSTHSACAFAVAGWLRASRHGRRLHAVAILIGYSRVRCRAHHSTDVVAGAVLGYGISWQVGRIWSRLRTGSRPKAVEAVPRESAPRPRARIARPAGHQMRRRGSHLKVG